MNYWWCLKHSRVESEEEIDSKGSDRVGPYPSAERAEHWRDEFAARNERLDREDKEWREGPSASPEGAAEG
ncbi:MAG: hypothetical protein QOC80_2271 [Frankiaceae bacterium]|nr:hypothetical protein [Frankiaceae bacterium]